MDFLVRSPSLHMNTKCNRLSKFAWELCAPFPCLSGNPRHCSWPWPSSLSPSGWKDHHQLTSLACDDSPPHTHTQNWQSPGHKITALQARCTAGPHLCSAAVLHHSPSSAGWCRVSPGLNYPSWCCSSVDWPWPGVLWSEAWQRWAEQQQVGAAPAAASPHTTTTTTRYLPTQPGHGGSRV